MTVASVSRAFGKKNKKICPLILWDECSSANTVHTIVGLHHDAHSNIAVIGSRFRFQIRSPLDSLYPAVMGSSGQRFQHHSNVPVQMLLSNKYCKVPFYVSNWYNLRDVTAIPTVQNVAETVYKRLIPHSTIHSLLISELFDHTLSQVTPEAAQDELSAGVVIIYYIILTRPLPHAMKFHQWLRFLYLCLQPKYELIEFMLCYYTIYA